MIVQEDTDRYIVEIPGREEKSNSNCPHCERHERVDAKGMVASTPSSSNTRFKTRDDVVIPS